MKYKIFTSAIAALMLLAPLAIGQDGSKAKAGSGAKAMADAKGAKMLPPEIMMKIKNGIQAARDGGVEGTAKKVGDAAPDATLTNFNGQSVQLSTLWQQGPVVLMWYRGGW